MSLRPFLNPGVHMHWWPPFRTRRVIALDKPPDRTAVRDVMTADPAMVSMDESAMEALGLMLQNKTRHLPVRCCYDSYINSSM